MDGDNSDEKRNIWERDPLQDQKDNGKTLLKQMLEKL
jgi:hypothetical protein